MPEEQQATQEQGIPSGLVLQILQQRAQRDKELALHLEAASLQAAVQQQQMTIQQLMEPEPDEAPAVKSKTKK